MEFRLTVFPLMCMASILQDVVNGRNYKCTCYNLQSIKLTLATSYSYLTDYCISLMVLMIMYYKL